MNDTLLLNYSNIDLFVHIVYVYIRIVWLCDEFIRVLFVYLLIYATVNCDKIFGGPLTIQFWCALRGRNI